MRKLKNKIAVILASIASLALTFAVPVAAATEIVVVTPLNTQGWVFNGDPDNATPYEFKEDKASIGEGSLFVEQIGNVGAHKFIAMLPLGNEVADVESIAYDFLIAGSGDADDSEKFYLNIYTNLAGSTTFYDCRFDYEPTTGSITTFTAATFDAADSPVNVGDRGGDAFDCPETLEGMPAGSTVSAFTLNVGDTSVNDEGLAGYLDNVVVSIAGDQTVYDFEATPTTKDDCKDGGWEGYGFKNQGQCVSFVAKQQRTLGNLR